MNKHFSINMVTYPMLRPFTIAALASICLLITAPRVDAGVISYMNVIAISSTNAFEANAAHGYIDENPFVSNGGDPLLRYLNSGTSIDADGTPTEFLTAQPGSKDFRLSTDGMFSSNMTTFGGSGLNSNIVDVVSINPDGFEARDSGKKWEFEGKFDAQENTSDFLLTSGLGSKEGVITLGLGKALSGSFVLSLKAGSTSSVYLFQDMSGITSFRFDLTSGDNALSHVALFTGGPTGGGGGGSGNNGNVPEPASLAIFGALLGIAGLRRRRNGVEKK